MSSNRFNNFESQNYAFYFYSTAISFAKAANRTKSFATSQGSKYYIEVSNGVNQAPQNPVHVSGGFYKGGFYKFISDDFVICFEQIAVRNEEAMRTSQPSDKQQDAERKPKAAKSLF